MINLEVLYYISILLFILLIIILIIIIIIIVAVFTFTVFYNYIKYTQIIIICIRLLIFENILCFDVLQCQIYILQNTTMLNLYSLYYIFYITTISELLRIIIVLFTVIIWKYYIFIYNNITYMKI